MIVSGVCCSVEMLANPREAPNVLMVWNNPVVEFFFSKTPPKIMGIKALIAFETPESLSPNSDEVLEIKSGVIYPFTNSIMFIVFKILIYSCFFVVMYS